MSLGIPLVTANDLWRHKNGQLYRVLFITNTATRREDHAPDVVYETVENGHKWSRPLSDWHRSFTLEERI